MHHPYYARLARFLPSLAAAGAAALLALGCSPSRTSGDPADAGAVDAAGPDAREFEPTGEHHQFVIDSIQLPRNAQEAAELGQDVDGDGTVDNALGQIIQILEAAVNTDVGALLTSQVDDGTVIILANLQATSLVNAERVGFWILRGGDPLPEPCADVFDTECRRHLDGAGSFSVLAADDAFIGGNIDDGHFLGSDFGTVTLYVPVMVGAPPIEIGVIGARAVMRVQGDGLTVGRLAGAITETEVQESLLPQLLALWNQRIAEQCFGTYPDCCPAGTDGAQLVDLFDADGSCDLSLEELQESSLINALLAPDVDLLDAEGFYNPNKDGVLDSVSLGVGFTAVSASFIPPADIAP
jgi:hypothetical protein